MLFEYNQVVNFRDHADRQEDDALMNSSGTEISRNIAKLAERRSDIFGVGVQGGEQTTIGKKLGEEEQRPAPPRPDPRTIWENQVGLVFNASYLMMILAIHGCGHPICPGTSSSSTKGSSRTLHRCGQRSGTIPGNFPDDATAYICHYTRIDSNPSHAYVGRCPYDIRCIYFTTIN